MFRGRLYVHHQEVILRFIAYGFVSCSSCCDIGESVATYSTQCTRLATRLSNITTVTTGQKTTGSETESDLLMMGVKTPPKHVEKQLITNKIIDCCI